MNLSNICSKNLPQTKINSANLRTYFYNFRLILKLSLEEHKQKWKKSYEKLSS